jgi:transposase-like protein/ribosomal protein S27AE
MRINVQLPKVEPDVYEGSKQCPRCGGLHFKAHGVKGEKKSVRDLAFKEVSSYRKKCLKCGHTVREYPRGVSRAQQSDRLKGISVLLYVLGLSYGAVADFLEAMGCAISKTTVYNNVQEAGVKARQRQGASVKKGKKRPVIGADGTYVKVKGERVGIEVVVDDESGELLGLDIIVSENSEEILEIIQDVAEEIDAEVIVSDDHGAYKEAAVELGLAHQICRSHVKRNVDELAESIQGQLRRKERLPEGVDSSPERLREDLEVVRQLVRSRPADASDRLGEMYHRYKAAPVPKKGQRHTAWYRMRTLTTRLWDRWPNLTLDQRRDDLDGTNNSCERLIGWWIKERYRTMRGYKRPESIRNVVTLTARMGVRSGRYDLTELYT